MLPQFLIFLLAFGRFAGAADLDYDVAGNIYVVDRVGNMLVKFSPRGDSVRAVSGFGRGQLQFDSPAGVCARRGNDIYVADYNNHRVQRFNRMLDYITTISTRDDPDERKRFGYPRDVAVTRQGDLMIVDGENRRILKIDAFGKVERAFGDLNAGAGRLVDPSQIEVDDEDNVYVLDRDRILQFDPFGSFVRDVPFPLPEGAIIRTISVDRDTLVVQREGDVSLIDLKTFSDAGFYGVKGEPAALRLIDGHIVGVEAARGVAYRAPGPDDPGE
jgi:DNA-binding beta-propeller fold protein YncE